MRSHSRVVLGLIVGIGILMISLLGFHLGGESLVNVGNFSPLLGAFIGGTLALFCVNLPVRHRENAEPWLRYERFAWALIGLGCVAWGIGEAFWRYYRAIGQTPFPSLADIGYTCLPPLVFAGLILLPASWGDQRRRYVLLDSLISVGALLSIAWFLLLGSLAQTPTESVLAKVLGLYYPTMDTTLVSCTVFLLLRGSRQVAPARRISLLVAGLGLFVFATSDFIFNIQQNLGTYAEGSWVDLGWPLGMMAMGAAAYLRRFLPATLIEQQLKLRARLLRFGPAQVLPYLLLVLLFSVLIFNVLSGDSTQQSIRPVLMGATMVVVSLVLIRQILTMFDNTQLVQKQASVLQERERINQSIAERNADLEAGIAHLKDIQTRLANGDVRARAHIINGELWPLATGLNLMADRMMRSERTQRDVQNVAKAVDDFSQALERMQSGTSLILPASCLHVPEMHRLFLALGLKPEPETPHSVYFQPENSPLSPLPKIPSAPLHRQPPPSPSSVRQWKESIRPRQDTSGTT